MVRHNIPAMNRRMKIREMPSAASPILDKYQDQLIETGRFDLDNFLTELCNTCHCTGPKAIMEMLSVLWHTTHDPVLVYYFDNVKTRPPEFEFYVSRAYGLKNYYDPLIAERRADYWTAFYETFSELQSV